MSDNPDHSRYEVRLDGELGGFAEYVVADGVITFTHAVSGSRAGG